MGSLNSSIEAYSVAICLDPTFLEAIVGRGNAYMDYLKEETNVLSRSECMRVCCNILPYLKLVTVRVVATYTLQGGAN